MSDKGAVNRVRIEASAPTEKDLRNLLTEALVFNRDREHGSWKVEEPGIEVQSTKDGYWGRVTIRRQDAQRDPLPAR